MSPLTTYCRWFVICARSSGWPASPMHIVLCILRVTLQRERGVAPKLPCYGYALGPLAQPLDRACVPLDT
eukprot:3052671-Pleurochrysis_carterae.AAC.6